MKAMNRLDTPDGAMNGFEFARCTTASGFTRVLVQAASGQATIEISTDDRVMARGDLDRHTGYHTASRFAANSSASRAAQRCYQ
jgi:hypothetical protein